MSKYIEPDTAVALKLVLKKEVLFYLGFTHVGILHGVAKLYHIVVAMSVLLKDARTVCVMSLGNFCE